MRTILFTLHDLVSVHCSEETPKKRSILTAATQAYVEESDDTTEEVLLIVELKTLKQSFNRKNLVLC